MGVLDHWYERAAAAPRRVLLADDDPRAHKAAARLNGDGLAEAIVIGRDLGSLADAGHPDAEVREVDGRFEWVEPTPAKRPLSSESHPGRNAKRADGPRR